MSTLPPTIPFNRAYSLLKTGHREIYNFQIRDENIDQKTVDSFGDEWQAFHGFDEKEIQKLGDEYFDIITPQMLNKTSSATTLNFNNILSLLSLNSITIMIMFFTNSH